MKKTKQGYYKHFKGGISKVIGEAKNSETGEIYVAYYHKEKETGKIVLWIRPKEMFFEKVKIANETKPRFEYLGDKIKEIEKTLSKV